MTSTAIWWLRRDLRLADNDALQAALEAAEQVLPVFVLDPALLNSPNASEKRTAFLLEGLRRLDADLRARGSYLIVRQGEPADELSRLMAESGAQTIYAHEDVSPYARRRDARVAARMPLELCGGPALRPPGTVLNRSGKPYTVFTAFSKAWKALPGLPAGSGMLVPLRIATPPQTESLALPEEPVWGDPAFPPGEEEAQRRLERFVSEAIYAYSERRNRPDLDGTSALSPYLRFGMLSARQAFAAARQAVAAVQQAAEAGGPGRHAGRHLPEAGWHAVFVGSDRGLRSKPGVRPGRPDAAGFQASADAWLNELIWREFYIHILYHFPHVLRENFRLAGVCWNNSPADFEAWKAGRTGYPIVDAAMRQLATTGWMHNRSRMITASFLTKDLLIDWRWGERWFMQHLIDGDPAANNGGWQWTAGTGTDAAPYFRIFNPVSQGLKTDPHGDFVRRWLPELERVPTEYIHAPWSMPEEVQRAAGRRIGVDYPAPIVDHAWAKGRALAAYRAAGRKDTL